MSPEWTVQAVTGHKSIKLVQHYGTLSSTLQGDSITKVEQFLKQKSVELTSGEQRVSRSFFPDLTKF